MGLIIATVACVIFGLVAVGFAGWSTTGTQEEVERRVDEAHSRLQDS